MTAQRTIVRLPGTVQVGQHGSVQTLAVSLLASGTAAAPQAVTEGIDAGEFTVASGGTCTAGQAYTAGQICTVAVVFAPRFPGRRNGAVLLKDAAGRLLGSTQVLGSATGSLPRLSPGRIDTVAGDRSWVYSGDGVGAIGAPIFLPQGLAVDVAGNLFISDSGNSRIRRVDAATGTISTVVGTGAPGYNGDGAQGTATSISQPAGLALDGAGNLYFADSGNGLIRRLDTVSGLVTIVAGMPNVQGYSGDGHLATAASLTLPEGVAFNDAGDLLIADTGNNAVRLVDAATAHIRTIAGTGIGGFSGDGGPAVLARLNNPWSLLVATDGSILIADFSNDRVRKISSAGVITTVAGNGARGFSGDGGLPTQATLDAPTALAMDPAGNLYIADSGNNRVRIVSIADGHMQTLAGNSGDSFTGDGGPANQASLYGPYALLFDAQGNLFVADMFHNRVRRISGQAITLTFPTIRVSKLSQPLAQGLVNAGNAALTLAAPALTNAALDANTSDCLTAAVAPGDVCNLGVEFAPMVIGTVVHGSVTVSSDAGGNAPVITVQGQVLSVEPTATALTISANPALVGDTLQLTATVSSDDASRSGEVVFLDGQNRLCAASLNTNGVAGCSTSSLTLGQHNLTASYAGDANNASSVSPVLIEIIKQAPQLLLEVTPNPAVITTTVTLRLTASAASGTPSGMASFFDGTTLLGTAMLNSAGVATFSSNRLTPGTHALTAQYGGDATNATATSNAVTETVEQASTVTTVASSSNVITVGETLTLSIQVSSPFGPSPTGTVTLRDGTAPLGGAAIDSSGRLSFALNTLVPGSHSFTATYEGDANSATSSSVPLSLTVSQITTATVVLAGANPLSAGAVLHLHAAVTLGQGMTAAGTLTGTVTFSDGSTVLGTDVLDASGQATLAVPGMSVGVHPITASYSGSVNYAPSSAPVLSEVVASTATTVSITGSTAASFAGKPVTFNISVASATGVPTGTVTLRDGNLVLGQAAVSDHGTAAFTLSLLPAGSHALSASYSGDASYTPSLSTPIALSVTLAQPSLTLSGPVNAVNAGVSTTLTAAVASNGVMPSGTLSLRDGAVTLATQAIGGGTLSFSLDSLAVGAHSLTVVYSGNENNSPATSNFFAVTVQLAPSTTSLTGQSPVTQGTNLTLVANVTSNSPRLSGSITFQDGASLLGSAAIGADGVARFTTNSLGAGDHALLATYSGDTNHAASATIVLNVRVVEPTTGGLSSTSNPAISGTTVSFLARFSAIASSTSGIPTGAVTFTDNGNSLGTAPLDTNGMATLSSAALAVGLHQLQASYAGDAHFASSSASFIQSISSASTQITLSAAQNPATYAAALVLTAAVSSNGGTATGSVVFHDGGGIAGSAVLNAQGLAQLTVSTLAPGGHTLTVSYAGDGRASASASGPFPVSVKQTTAVVVTSSANPALTLSPVQLTAVISNAGAAEATGAVQFLDGTFPLGSAPLDAAGHASLVLPQMQAGTHTLSARYEGDEKNFAGQTTVSFMQVVQRRQTATVLTSSATNTANPQQVTLIALVHGEGFLMPGGTVSFRSGNSLLGTSPLDATGVATLTIDMETQQQSVSASYGGDASYVESNSPALAVTAGAATQFTLQVNPTEVSVASKQHIAVNLTLRSIKGFNDTLKLGCLGLPFAATCTFSTAEAKLAADGTTAVQLMLDTGNPLGAGAQSAQAHDDPGKSGTPGAHGSRYLLVCFLPAALVLLSSNKGRRRFRSMQLFTVLLAAALTLAASGCAGLQMSGTPAGSYTFKVTASGAGSGATQSQTVVLTVTQ